MKMSEKNLPESKSSMVNIPSLDEGTMVLSILASRLPLFDRNLLQSDPKEKAIMKGFPYIHIS